MSLRASNLLPILQSLWCCHNCAALISPFPCDSASIFRTSLNILFSGTREVTIRGPRFWAYRLIQYRGFSFSPVGGVGLLYEPLFARKSVKISPVINITSPDVVPDALLLELGGVPNCSPDRPHWPILYRQALRIMWWTVPDYILVSWCWLLAGKCKTPIKINHSIEHHFSFKLISWPSIQLRTVLLFCVVRFAFHWVQVDHSRLIIWWHTCCTCLIGFPLHCIEAIMLKELVLSQNIFFSSPDVRKP